MSLVSKQTSINDAIAKLKKDTSDALLAKGVIDLEGKSLSELIGTIPAIPTSDPVELSLINTKLIELENEIENKLNTDNATDLLKLCVLSDDKKKLIFTRFNDEPFEILLPEIIINEVVSGEYDSETKNIVLKLTDESEVKIDVSLMISPTDIDIIYRGVDTPTIDINITEDNDITADIKADSITSALLSPVLREDIVGLVFSKHSHENKSIIDSILQENINNWDTVINKIDKQTGYSLISDVEKTRLSNLTNFDNSINIDEINTLKENDITINEKLVLLEAIAKGRERAIVFNTLSDLNLWLTIANNIQDLRTGDNFYIIEKDVPDYYWDGEEIQELETAKVDLTEYIKRLEVMDIVNPLSYNVVALELKTANINNTADIDKPISTLQKEYVDNTIAESISETTIYTPGEVWVNDQSPNGGDGSFTRPYNKLIDGVNAIEDNYDLMVIAGTYVGNLTLHNKQNVRIICSSVVENYSVIVTGDLQITGDSSNISLVGIQIDGEYTNPSTGSGFYFNNVKIGSQKTILNTGYHRYNYCFFKELQILGEGAYVDIRNSKCEDNATWSLDNEKSTLYLESVEDVALSHTGGNMILNKVSIVPTDNEVGIYSVAVDGGGSLLMLDVDFMQSDTTYARVLKFGDCPYTLGISRYDINKTMLNGTIIKYGLDTNQIYSTANISNYTTDNTGTVTSHLEGIDSKLEEFSRILTSVFIPKGTKNTYSELPVEGNEVGDVWSILNGEGVIDNGDAVFYTQDGTWAVFSGSVDMRNFYTKSEVDVLLTNNATLEDLNDIAIKVTALELIVGTSNNLLKNRLGGVV